MLNSSAKAHTIHPLIEFPGIILLFIVEGARDNGSLLIPHFIIGTAYQLKGAGVITPLAYLLTLWLTSSVRGRGTKRGTAPLTQRQAESVLVLILLGFVLPSVLVVFTFSLCWIAFWQPFPWWMSAMQALYYLAVPLPSSSSPSSEPGSGSTLFKSTLYTFSTAGAIAHWVFLQLLPFRLSIPPHDLPAAEAFAQILEWDTVMCHATASLGVLRLDIARTKTTSVDGWLKEVVGQIDIGVVAGPGAMLCTIWGERGHACACLEGRGGEEDVS